MSQQELKQNLKNRWWRLNNIYWIKNDEGQRILFQPNWAQKILFENLWFLNVILKVRQLGVTTFFCILYLDSVLFDGKDAGLIAHTLHDAQLIFDTKVKYAWDNLPEAIKGRYEVNTDNVRELVFKRDKVESRIYVGTSLRSGTVQLLHLSEIGTSDQKYPVKSEEIKSGALNTVHKGQIITMESTAKVPIGVFYDTCSLAMDNEKAKKILTEMDWKFFFLPWWKHKEYELEGEIIIPVEMQEYFLKVETENQIKLTQAQKNWYFKKWQTQRGTMKREFPSYPAEAFTVAIEGSYFGKETDRVLNENRLRSVPWEPLIPVDTWWDLGTSKIRKDACSIWFTQDIGLEIHIIDFYSNTGEGLLHYAKTLTEKPYLYGSHWAPHDIQVKEIGTGKTRLETAIKVGIPFKIVPNIPFLDGIEAARNILPKCWFDEEKTGRAFKALQVYRKEWDEKLAKFKDEPLKDWSADPADAFRMMAVGHRDHQRLAGYDKEEEELLEIKQREEEKRMIDVFNPFPQI